MLKSSGLTLIELLVVAVLLSILSFFCFPHWQIIHQKNQLQILQDEIGNAVRFARTHSILRGETLILTPLPDTSDWSSGMLLWVDNPTHQYVLGSTLIHQWRWKNSGFHVTWHGFQSSRYLLFSADVKKAASSGHFLIAKNSQQPVKLTVNRLGRIARI